MIVIAISCATAFRCQLITASTCFHSQVHRLRCCYLFRSSRITLQKRYKPTTASSAASAGTSGRAFKTFPSALSSITHSDGACCLASCERILHREGQKRPLEVLSSGPCCFPLRTNPDVILSHLTLVPLCDTICSDSSIRTTLLKWCTGCETKSR